MSLDDRLEALTQTVELMAAMQRDNERRFQKQFEQHEQLFGQVALRLREVGDYIDSLAQRRSALGKVIQPSGAGDLVTGDS